MSPKEKNKRSRERYPALKPELNLKTRYELIDYDYLDKLSPQEKEWLNKFSSEFINASFNKDDEDNIQKDKKYRKDSYDRNNARNRDILTRLKACGQIEYLEELKNMVYKDEEESEDVDTDNISDNLKDTNDEPSE